MLATANGGDSQRSKHECRENVKIMEKVTFTHTGLLSSMQHYNGQILASAEGTKVQQRGGEPPISPKPGYL